MKQIPKPPESIAVHWTYSPDEWSNFLKKHSRKQGFFVSISRLLFGSLRRKAPAVFISPEKIVIGTQCRHFNNHRTFIKTVDLRDQGGVNILSIKFAVGESAPTADEIVVPVPRGKLKEAIRLQENLLRIVDA